jgi:hypothetical protein
VDNLEIGMTFSEAFIANKGAPIPYGSSVLHWTYWIAIHADDNIEIIFERFKELPVQGICIAAENATLNIVGSPSPKFVLWTDTAPRHVTVRVVHAGADARVSIFNVWRDEQHGSMMYRVNNAAMQIQPQDDGSVVLRCSDGYGVEHVDFDDLVIRLQQLRDPK